MTLTDLGLSLIIAILVFFFGRQSQKLANKESARKLSKEINDKEKAAHDEAFSSDIKHLVDVNNDKFKGGK